MIKSTPELVVEARDCLEEIIEYVASETADISLLTWLKDLEAKLLVIDNRLTSPVKQQSDFETVKSYIKAGKLPPLDSVKTGIQYINSNK